MNTLVSCHEDEVSLANIKIERQRLPEKAFNIGRVETQYVAVVK